MKKKPHNYRRKERNVNGLNGKDGSNSRWKIKGSQLINELTAWDGRKAFELLSLPLPRAGESESAKQKQAREIIEGCLQRGFGFKLVHGLILKVLGDTLGSLRREHEGSDNVPEKYSHWLRHDIVYWNQGTLPQALQFQIIEPFKKGPLLREV
ncbi:hypothetical protein DL769_003839 [Monosporascus sp. CRB-8-3]|nr:hypothetical protein DL769_003839 [Monosporascus sp. CRB-8-3]